jgi:hypothetical protein
MDYTADNERFASWVSKQQGWIGGQVPSYPGLGVHADGCNYTGPVLAAEQIRIAREHGAGGFVIFNYSELLARDYLPYLALGITREPSRFTLRAAGLQQEGR